MKGDCTLAAAARAAGVAEITPTDEGGLHPGMMDAYLFVGGDHPHR